MIRTVLVLTMLASTPAMAWPTPPVTTNVHGGAGGNAAARSTARSTAIAQGTASAATGASTSSVTLSGVGGSSTPPGARVGPSVFVPDGSGQAPCGGGIGLGAGALSSGGAGGGTLWEFGDCKRMRESAALRSLAVETGDARLQQAALNELCQIDRIREAFGGHCPVIGERTPTVEPARAQYRYPAWCRTSGGVWLSDLPECRG